MRRFLSRQASLWCNGKAVGYERARWPRTAPALPVLLTYLTDQHGLSRADLVPLLGTASRVSEVLTGKRDLNSPRQQGWLLPRPTSQTGPDGDIR
jgi:hypothetical protein